MSKRIDDLVDQINVAENRLVALISDDAQPSSSEVAKLDKQLCEAFEALMAAPLSDSPDYLGRIRFLTSYVGKHTDHSRLIARVLVQIESDAEAISELGANDKNS